MAFCETALGATNRNLSNLKGFPMDFDPWQGASWVKADRLRGKPRAGLNAHNLLRVGAASNSRAMATSNTAFGAKGAEIIQDNSWTPHQMS